MKLVVSEEEKNSRSSTASLGGGPDREWTKEERGRAVTFSFGKER